MLAHTYTLETSRLSVRILYTQSEPFNFVTTLPSAHQSVAWPSVQIQSHLCLWSELFQIARHICLFQDS